MFARAVFLDIGANVGVYSIMLSQEDTVAETHAVEALTALADEIQGNIELNGLSGEVQVHRTVLSDSDGQVDFLVRSRYAGDGGVLETHQYAHIPYDHIESLRTTKLDDLVTIEGRDVIAKIDVEGHEIGVLRGAERTLRSNRGFLQVEVLTEESLREAESLLQNYGWFRLFVADRDAYFSNIPEYESVETRLKLLEDGISQFVDRNRRGEGTPTRKRILPGVTLEIPRARVHRVRQLVRRTPK